MKQLFCTVACISICLFFISAKAQNCKPDYSQLDKIEKKQIDAWSCDLHETGFGSRMINTSHVYITFSLARMGDLNFVQLTLRKYEESLENAIIESPLRGAKGVEFDFGIKNGDPLKFVTTKATNQTKKDNILGRIVTTVTLSSEIKNEDLQSVKDALTGNVIDALRIGLGEEIVLSVKEKKGDKMKEKARCFFNFLEGRGLLKAEKGTGGVKTKTQDNDTKNIETPPAKKTGNVITQKKEDDNIPGSEEPDNSGQFEGVWESTSKKGESLVITKINANNFEVKRLKKIGPSKKNFSPCPTFEFINNDLVCQQFKIIYLPGKNAVYFDGSEYKRE